MSWERLAIRGARREAASRRYFHRIWQKGIEKYGAYLRRTKRGEHLDRDYRSLRLQSGVLAHSKGIDAEGWQDVYYRELERCGEKAPPSVRERFAKTDQGI